MPFFLYYPMMLTHDPYQPTPDSKDWDPKAQGEQINRKPEQYPFTGSGGGFARPAR